MSRDNSTLLAVYKVLQDYYGVPESNLHPDLSINGDVGIDGDDAVELISFIEDETGLKATIDFSVYFFGEGLIQFGGRKNLTVLELSSMFSANVEKPET